MKKARVGADIGGTFTDIIMFIGGKILKYKLLSTPADPALAVVKGVRKLLKKAEIDLESAKVIHGSTIAVNALLERKGAVTALITTKGFEDIIEIGRQNRPVLYDLFVDTPEPLVSSEFRFGVAERTLNSGKIERDVDENELEALLKKLKSKKVESVAICLLHSYANPENETEIKRILEKLGFHISTSHEVLPEYREYERMSTTVANAYIAPLMDKYLQRLEDELGKIQVMQSNGGIVSAKSAREIPIRTVMSGPTGGVVGASYIARISGFQKAIIFDMGGTSTDVSLYDGEMAELLKVSVENEVAGIPIRVPMVEIHTVGAGGGSIAHVDPGGALRVGPQSAGANPGPVCYGKGDRLTVTDANLLLGRIPSEGLLGGEMSLDINRTKAVMKKFAGELGYSVQEACEGIIRIANAAMEKAIRVISVEKGYDSREFTLISFGGAGGLHACELAELLSIPCVIVPPNPGLLSAFGMSLADLTKDYSQTVLKRVSETTNEEIILMFQSLEEQALNEMRTERFYSGEIQLFKSIDMRYEGQSYELTVPFNAEFKKEFESAYSRRFAHLHPRAEMEIVTLRLRTVGLTEKGEFELIEQGTEDSSNALIDERNLFYKDTDFKMKIYDRRKLCSNNSICGPAVITEYSSTTFVPPGFTCKVDRFGNLLMGVFKTWEKTSKKPEREHSG